MAKRGYDIMRDYRATGNRAIDGVASCIIWHRQRKIALRAIHLKEMYYDWFRVGVEVLQGRPLEDGELMMFDGVNIEKGDRRQRSAILPELWTSES